MRRLFAFVLGFLGSYFGVAAIMIALISMRVIVDRDGGATMGVIFVLAPIAALIGGVLSAILFGRQKAA